MKPLASDEIEITLSVENERELPDMKIELPRSTTVTTWEYIRELYAPEDPVAVVLIRKEPSLTIQRVESAGKVAGQAYQRYLRAQNAQGFNVYISMNPVFATYAVRLTVPVAELENIKNVLREASFLNPEKAAFEQEAGEASLTWKFRAD